MASKIDCRCTSNLSPVRMAGGGRRKNSKGSSSTARNHRSAGHRFKSLMFADAGILSSFFSPSPAGNACSEAWAGHSNRGNVPPSRNGMKRVNGNAISFACPAVDVNDAEAANDNTSLSESPTVNYEYSYGSNFVLGESSQIVYVKQCTTNIANVTFYFIVYTYDNAKPTGSFHKVHGLRFGGSFHANVVYTCHRCNSGKSSPKNKSSKKKRSKKKRGNRREQ